MKTLAHRTGEFGIAFALVLWFGLEQVKDYKTNIDKQLAAIKEDTAAIANIAVVVGQHEVRLDAAQENIAILRAQVDNRRAPTPYTGIH